MTTACGDDTTDTGNGGQGDDTTTSTSSAAPGQGGGGSGPTGSGGAPSGEGGGGAPSGDGGAPSGEGGAPSGDGGGGEGGTPPAGDPNCSADTATFTEVKAILTMKCASCHGNPPAPPASGLDLRANNAHKQLTEKNASCGGRKIVVPSKPSESYLLNKLTNKEICDGTPMPPPPSSLLTAAETKKINDWICAGAPDN